MDICDNLSDGLHAAPNFDPFGEYLFVNAINLENGFIVDKGDGKRADQLEYEKYRIDLNERTILYSIDGSIGKIAKYRGEKVILGKGACYIMLKETVNTDYIYYLLQSSIFQGYLKAMTTGSTIHHISLETMRNFRFDLPKRKVQDRIATVLSLLDNRIDLNNSICAELESMAKTLYDFWFVQFDFPDENGKPYRTNGGRMKKCSLLKTDIPTNWNICSIEEACDIIDCLHSKKPEYKYEDENYYLLVLENLTKDGYIDVSQKYYISGSDYGEWTSRIEVKENDFVMTNAGRAGDIGKIPAGIKCAIGRNLTAIHPRKINAYYLREFFKSIFVDQQIQSGLDTGSFFKSFNVRSIKKLSILLPDEETMDRYVGIVTPIIRRIEAILSENQELVKMRDWLLPMLMNGQVKVMDANKEEVPIAEETTASTDDPRFVEWLNM